MIKKFDSRNLKFSALFLGAAVCSFGLSACSFQDISNAFSSDEGQTNAATGNDALDQGYGYNTEARLQNYNENEVDKNQTANRSFSAKNQIPSSIIVCRSKKCAPASRNMSKEALYNAYYSLMENNVGTNILLCQADSVSHICYEPFISFDVNAGIAPATVVVDAAKVLDIGMVKNNEAIVPILDYSVYANGIRTRCSPSTSLVKVKNPNYMVIEGSESECRFTATGKSSLSMIFTVDYIDFDYGIIGASYSVGVAGSTAGGGNGYALLRFKNPVGRDVMDSTCEENPNLCERKFEAATTSGYVAPATATGSYKPAMPPVPSAPAPVVGGNAKATDLMTDRAQANEYYHAEAQAAAVAQSDSSVNKFFPFGDKKVDRIEPAIPFQYDALKTSGGATSATGRNITYEDFANKPANVQSAEGEAKPASDRVIISPAPRG